MILSKGRMINALISLLECSGWSTPLLFANPEDRFKRPWYISTYHADAKLLTPLCKCNIPSISIWRSYFKFKGYWVVSFKIIQIFKLHSGSKQCKTWLDAAEPTWIYTVCRCPIKRTLGGAANQWGRSINFGLEPLCTFLRSIRASSESSGESAIHRLAWAVR